MRGTRVIVNRYWSLLSTPSTMTDACNAIISVLNDNDVLLGRGRGSTNHIGNERFRALTRLRKEEYKLCDNNGQKTNIAYEIFHEVVDIRGGRFLQLVDDGNPPRDILETGTCVTSMLTVEFVVDILIDTLLLSLSF